MKSSIGANGETLNGYDEVEYVFEIENIGYVREEDGGYSICYPYYQFMDVSDDYDGYYFALDSANKNSASVEFNFMPKGAGKYAISIDAFIQGKDELKDLADSKQYYTVQVI